MSLNCSLRVRGCFLRVVTHHQLHNHVTVLVLASKQCLERLVDLLEREASRNELLDAGQTTGAKESEGVGVGVAAAKARLGLAREALGGRTHA